MEALNLEGITISSAQLVSQSSTRTARKRRATKCVQKAFSWSVLSFHCSATNTECGTSSCTAGGLFSIVFLMKYSPRCLDSVKCRKTSNEMFQSTITTLRCKLTLAIPFVGGSVLDVKLTFCSFGQFKSGKRCMWWYSNSCYLILWWWKSRNHTTNYPNLISKIELIFIS